MLRKIRSDFIALNPRKRSLVVLYCFSALWALVFLVLPPSSISDYFAFSVGTAVSVGVLIGAALGLSGSLRQDNLLLERSGVVVLLGGYVSYVMLQLGLLVLDYISRGTSDREYLTLLALALVSVVYYRLQELNQAVEEAKKLPLDTEEI